MKERDHDTGYRMVFNSPQSREEFHTRLNPSVEEQKEQPAQPPPSFISYSTTTVNGVPVSSSMTYGG